MQSFGWTSVKKAGFVSPRSSEITVAKEKERRKRKSEEKERRREKISGCTLSFLMATLATFGWKKLLEGKGRFGDNVIKNPARYIYMYMYTGKKWEKKNWRSEEGYTCRRAKETIHLYDKQFHVVWQDIRAPNEKGPDCHTNDGNMNEAPTCAKNFHALFTFESHIKVALSLLLTFG